MKKDIWIIKPSSRKGKKLMAEKYQNNNKIETQHFGAFGYNDFTTYWKEDKEKAKQRKELYLARSNSNTEKYSSGWWAREILWNKPTIKDSVKDLRKKGINVKYIN